MHHVAMVDHRITLALIFAAVVAVNASGAASAPDYDRDVRPILSDRCYQCHGPDEETRAADLRLDTAEGLVDWVVVPNEPDDSELLRRVLSEDPDERMPPPETGLKLTAAEKETLQRWIAAGAVVERHWSFQPLPKEVAPPPVQDAARAASDLDRFVLARLEQAGLQPTSPAEPLRLLRRMSLDLTGLPPSLAEIESFRADLADGVDAALARAADRLLAAPAYGEHMAVAWLDAVRYADSYGYQSDQLNSQWPYRDWVVRALNDNLPFDQFLTWQLAGDLLPNATTDQVLATAFNRMHRMTNEGGSLPEEWLVENAADRVNTFGTAVLGLTLECARCHDHKYDPIASRDYYSFMSFFNSIDENGLYDHAAKIPSPSLLLPTDEQAAARAAAADAATEAERAWRQLVAAGEDRFTAWAASENADAPMPELAGCFHFDGDAAHPANAVGDDLPPGESAGVTPCRGVQGEAVRFDGDGGIEFPQLLEADRWDEWTLDFWLRDTAADPRPVVVAQRTFGTDVGYNGLDVMLEGGFVTVRIYRVWPGNGIGLRTRATIPPGQWRHLAVTYDGSSQAAGIRVFFDGQPADVEVLRDHIDKQTAVRAHGNGRFALGARFRDRGFKGGEVDELKVFRRALSPLEIAELHEPGAIAAAR
ncbi:MAG: DUF1549 domain-containing protein, partial [Planctomycetales bacterium]|nr:DUF1549 domain-containing protein [Planctomycetales bacterium]